MDKDVVTLFQRGVETLDFNSSFSIGEELVRGLSVVVCTYKRAWSLNRFLDSLATQDRKPEKLVIVDASPDEETERAIKGHPAPQSLAKSLLYVRVTGSLKGLTRQRNFGLNLINTDLVAFFDDDIVLLPGCLAELEKPHRAFGNSVVGVGAFGRSTYVERPFRGPSALWRLRLLLRMVPDLKPGKYHRSGISIPWGFQPSTQEMVEGDYLPGGAVMWKTKPAREVKFFDGFGGYAQGEDVEFSLRILRRGKLMCAGKAQLLHLQESTGRPDHFKLGYMAIYNRYQIHRRGLNNRTKRDIAWFAYAWTLDTIILGRRLFNPSLALATIKEWGGRFKAVFDLMTQR